MSGRGKGGKERLEREGFQLTAAGEVEEVLATLRLDVRALAGGHDHLGVASDSASWRSERGGRSEVSAVCAASEHAGGRQEARAATYPLAMCFAPNAAREAMVVIEGG